MQLAYALLAQSAEFSRDGKLYVLGGDFDTIWANSFPAAHPFMCVVVKLVASPEDLGQEHGLTVRLVAPEGNLIAQATIPVRLPADAVHRQPKVGLLANILGATFAAPGPHVVVLEVDGNEVGRLPLHVAQSDKEREG